VRLHEAYPQGREDYTKIFTPIFLFLF